MYTNRHTAPHTALRHATRLHCDGCSVSSQHHFPPHTAFRTLTGLPALPFYCGYTAFNLPHLVPTHTTHTTWDTSCYYAFTSIQFWDSYALLVPARSNLHYRLTSPHCAVDAALLLFLTLPCGASGSTRGQPLVATYTLRLVVERPRFALFRHYG